MNHDFEIFWKKKLCKYIYLYNKYLYINNNKFFNIMEIINNNNQF